MKDERLWCYGLSKSGKFYGNEPFTMEERWEAMEKGNELAQYEDAPYFYIGRVNGEEIEDVEEIETKCYMS